MHFEFIDMLSITDLKIGTKIIFKGDPYEVVWSQHVQMGRGGGIMRARIKNLKTGAILEQTFKGNDRIEEAELEKAQAQYLYREGEDYFFMDNVTYDQFFLKAKHLGESVKFLKEGQALEILKFNGQPINVNLPIKIKLKVTYTEPGFKGDTAANTTKPATLETGAEIQVPLFVRTDDIIVVDTRTGKYIERA